MEHNWDTESEGREIKKWRKTRLWSLRRWKHEGMTKDVRGTSFVQRLPVGAFVYWNDPHGSFNFPYETVGKYHSPYDKSRGRKQPEPSISAKYSGHGQNSKSGD